MEEIREKLNDLKDKFDKIFRAFDRDILRTEIRELEAQTMKEGFWNNPQESQVISRKLSDKQKMLSILEELETRIKNAIEISGEVTMEEDLKKETREITKVLDDLELHLFLSGPHDPSEAIELLTKMADKARREGLLALEEESKKIKDPFLQKGKQLFFFKLFSELIQVKLKQLLWLFS
ncbi:MAG: Peptide chain release factor 2 [Parcubacteria group bacterium GW2011_GWC1_38_6]|nr:MAG: Peptide chain release factor 2 [Parcubacteria group bacterium GW2011_GWC1_38_6]